MRTLTARPNAVVDPTTRALAAGSFRGGIPRVDASALQKSRAFRVAREKRWVYAGVAAGDVFVAAAIVRLGYAANAFAFVFDRADGKLLADFSVTAPSFAAEVGDTPSEGCVARLRLPGCRLAIERDLGARDYRLEIATKALRISARLGTSRAPEAIGAIASFGGGHFSATQKLVLLPTSGELVVGGAHRSLEGGLAGVDYTSGFLTRRTAWRWAFALGRTKTGEPFALNLVQGFVGAPECAMWIGDDLVPLSEGVITFDAAQPLSPWTIRTRDGEVDLRFAPGAVHAEAHDFKIVSSRFLQPVGSFTGAVRVEGRPPVEIDRVLGVVEDQDVVW